MININNIKLYNGDCIEVMGELENNSVDLVVTDPPYLMDYQSNRRKKEDRFDKIKNDKGNYILIQEYLEECHRIMKDNTAIYCFCSCHNIDFFKKEFEKYFKLKNIIVWNKNNYGDLTPIIEELAREENCKVNDIELIEDYKGRIFREYE